MEFLDPNLFSELAKYLSCSDIRNFKFAFPKVDIQKGYLIVQKFENKIIESTKNKCLFKVLEIIIKIDKTGQFIYNYQEVINKYKYETKYSFDIDMSLFAKIGFRSFGDFQNFDSREYQIRNWRDAIKINNLIIDNGLCDFLTKNHILGVFVRKRFDYLSKGSSYGSISQKHLNRIFNYLPEKNQDMLIKNIIN